MTTAQRDFYQETFDAMFCNGIRIIYGELKAAIMAKAVADYLHSRRNDIPEDYRLAFLQPQYIRVNGEIQLPARNLATVTTLELADLHFALYERVHGCVASLNLNGLGEGANLRDETTDAAGQCLAVCCRNQDHSMEIFYIPCIPAEECQLLCNKLGIELSKFWVA